MKFSLYPYNYWILYIALGVTVVFLVLTVLKSLPLLKQTKTLQPTFQNIQKNAQLTKIKTEVLQEKFKKSSNSIDWIAAFMLLRTIFKDYKQGEERGFKAFKNSATRVMNQKNTRKQIMNTVMKRGQ